MEGAGAGYTAGQPQTLDEDREIAEVGEVVRIDPRRRQGIVRAERDAAPAARSQQGGTDAEPVARGPGDAMVEVEAGTKVDLDVRRGHVWPGLDEPAGLGHVRGEHATPKQQVLQHVAQRL